jgi:limonene-1,2-epoxide hydrolase
VDRGEALAIVEAELAGLREAPYRDHVDRLLGKQEVFERVGASGTGYSVELQALWDDKRLGNLRVIASIDDGGWRAFAPLSVDFIRAPDGSFVGE